jgi:hypothetical protein
VIKGSCSAAQRLFILTYQCLRNPGPGLCINMPLAGALDALCVESCCRSRCRGFDMETIGSNRSSESCWVV